jgi:hypothetical protein
MWVVGREYLADSKVNHIGFRKHIYRNMKKSELTQLTQIIEVLVTREIRKQLPKLIGEVFQNMAGKSMVVEHTRPVREDYVGKDIEQPKIPKDPHEFRASLKELFSGATPVTRSELEEGNSPDPIRKTIQYAKDPVLNKILNETTPDLKAREHMTGMAAFQGGYNPVASPVANVLSGQPPVPIREDHVPLADIPQGVSALDVARAGVAPAAVTEALTNYDRMKQILNHSKEKRH